MNNEDLKENEELSNNEELTNDEELSLIENEELTTNEDLKENEELTTNEDLKENEEREQLEAELRCLNSRLCSNRDELGDWKLSKIHEYNLLGLECPYTEEELSTYHTERQKIRDRINEIEERLSLMYDI